MDSRIFIYQAQIYCLAPVLGAWCLKGAVFNIHRVDERVRICFLCLEESVLQKAIFRQQTLILIISEECLSICVKLCCSTRFTKNLAFLVVKVAKSKKPGSSSRKSILALFVLVLLPENVISHMEVLGKSA